MLLEWIVAVIVAFSSTWSPRECEPEDEACVAANEQKEEQLHVLAQSILDESERQDLDPLMVAAVIAKESSFVREPCTKRVALTNVISWEPDGRSDDSFTLKWRCPNSSWGPECEKRVWDAEERGEYLYYSTCSADEVGLMQIVPWTGWAQAGAVIPGTEQTVTGVLQGEEGSHAVELHAPVLEETAAEWRLPAIEGTMVLQLTLPDDRDRDLNPELWGSVVRAVETIDSGVRLALLKPLPTDLDGFANFTFAQGLPRASGERREMLLDTRTNIAIGCNEISDQRAAHAREGEDWWDWIGTYNTGSRGETATAYAGRILRQYSQMCETIVSTGEEGNEVRLKDVYDSCATVEEARERRR